jgi:hypothetical protein
VKVYIAGPMSGYVDFNYPAFHAAAKAWRKAGHEVINPAENEGGDTSKPYAYYMRQDINHVLNVEAIAVLPGWQKSRGAALEVAIARILDYPIFDAVTMEPYEETAVQEAQRLVHGDRGSAYGHPIDDFGRTGRLWGAILGLPGDVAPELVGLCMAAVKISREVNKPSRDNRVDLAGYAETVQMVMDRKEAIAAEQRDR